MRKIILIAALLFSVSAFADGDSGGRFFNFRFNQLTILQGSNSSYSASGTWNPYYFPGKNVGFVADLGGGWIVGNGIKNFAESEYALLLALRMGSVQIEAGGGAQTWYWSLGTTTAGMADGNLLFLLGKGFFSGIYLGYSCVFQTVVANEIKAGIQIKF